MPWRRRSARPGHRSCTSPTRQPDGHLAPRGADPEVCRVLPENVVDRARRGVHRFRPARHRLADGTGGPARAPPRTFSKAHGLAGARIGYCVGHRDLVTGLNKIRNHFGVSRIAQVGALASLRDPEFVARVVTEVAAGREEYARLAASLGLVALPSATNFVAIDVGGGDRARALLEELEARGVFGPHAAGSAPRPLHPHHRRAAAERAAVAAILPRPSPPSIPRSAQRPLVGRSD